MRLLATLFALCLILACTPAPEGSTDSLDASQYRGRWLLVNYWAEWCQPCRREIPELNRLAGEFGDNVAVLGVNFDGLEGEALANAVAALAIEFPSTGEDPAAALDVQRPRVLPTTYVFDPEGKLVHTLLGPQTYGALAALIEEPQQP